MGKHDRRNSAKMKRKKSQAKMKARVKRKKQTHKAGAPLLTEPPQQFKFVTGDQRWLELPREATNLVPDGKDHFNRALLRHRTGRNLFEFTTTEPVLLNQAYSVVHVRDGKEAPKTRVRLGKFFCELQSDLALGAIVHRGETTFRLFAPRARHVRLFLCEKLEEMGKAFGYELDRQEEAGKSGSALYGLSFLIMIGLLAVGFVTHHYQDTQTARQSQPVGFNAVPAEAYHPFG